VRRPPRSLAWSDEDRWQVLKAKSLPELVQRSNELSTEIKELDSDMQMLVYENYNKFISATETIQDMKTKVDGMEGEMGRLATAVSEITGGIEGVL
jgi:methyl-accepting chemotaxis protein